MAQIVLHGVSKRFGSVEVIRDLSLDIASGELVVFLGPSGSGKTTLLRMIAGLETIDDGSSDHRRRAIRDVAARPAAACDGVPELCALPAYDRGREHGVRAEEHPGSGADDQGARGRSGAHSRDGGAARPPALGTVGRTAAAGGDRPGHREGAEGVPVRRTVVEPRRGAARPHPGGTGRTAPATEVDDDLRHPRSGRGDDAGRPDRDARTTAGSSRSARRWRCIPGRRHASWRASSARRR